MMLYKIIKTEWLILFRSRIIIWLLSALMALSMFTIWQTAIKFGEADTQRLSVIQHMRERFTAQGAVNPHGAAHYGHVIYKPMNVLSIVDEGVNPFTGITLRLEAHKQNEVMFSPSQGSSSLVRFGELRLSLVLQILIPLFILFACHNAITKEKENGTLTIAISQGVTLRELIWGKTIAYTLLWCTVLLANIALLWIATKSVSDHASAARLAGILLLYSVYYFIITALSVYISALSKKSSNALLVMLSAWLLFTVILPKATANIGENLSPLITKLEMEKGISDDNKKGINGHDPRDERAERFKDSLLKKYAVDALSKLPVNADGLLMQADEEYHNSVYDRYFGEVQQTIRKQNNVTAVSSFLNPFAAVRNLSMALSGTDVYHHFDFTLKAENFRRVLIRQLNTEMAYGGSKTGDWDWSVSPAYWEKIDDFSYSQQSAKWSLSHDQYELTALVCWLIITVLLIHFTVNRISII